VKLLSIGFHSLSPREAMIISLDEEGLLEHDRRRFRHHNARLRAGRSGWTDAQSALMGVCQSVAEYVRANPQPTQYERACIVERLLGVILDMASDVEGFVFMAVKAWVDVMMDKYGADRLELDEELAEFHANGHDDGL
jgi:hypothetical protein